MGSSKHSAKLIPKNTGTSFKKKNPKQTSITLNCQNDMFTMVFSEYRINSKHFISNQDLPWYTNTFFKVIQAQLSI